MVKELPEEESFHRRIEDQTPSGRRIQGGAKELIWEKLGCVEKTPFDCKSPCKM
jgi:hypothetical protein